MSTVTRILLRDGIDHAQSAVKQLLFMMAASRVRGGGCLMIDYAQKDAELEARIGEAVRRTLARLKKRGDIQLFLTAGELDSERTEARYLLEKCPAIAEEAIASHAVFYAYL